MQFTVMFHRPSWAAENLVSPTTSPSSPRSASAVFAFASSTSAICTDAPSRRKRSV
jgi:hypothetical protein